MTERIGNESNGDLRQQAEQIEATRGGRSATTPDVPIVARVVRRHRARIFQAFAITAAIGFAILFSLARSRPYFHLDLKVAHWIQSWQTFSLDVLMQSVSELGFKPLAPVVVILTIVFFYVVGLKWESVVLVLTSAVIGILDLVMKDFVQRKRPTTEQLDIFTLIGGYSFPSGHVLMFTVYLGLLLFMIYTLVPRSWPRTMGVLGLGILIGLVGVSRVYLGHHWPSDVLGAYLIGSLSLAVIIYGYRKGKKRFFTHQPLAAAEPAGEAAGGPRVRVERDLRAR